ncbi:MAG: hypothetical protein WBI82_11100 [Sphaerochaeta sp.]
MIEYYTKFIAWRVFSHAQVVDLCGNTKTAETVLYHSKRKGLIQHVKRSLYVAISLETGSSIASPYEIASQITADSYISHHTAFSYYGFANQVFTTITVSSSSRFKSFEYDGYWYQFKQSYSNQGLINAHGVRATVLERTIIDTIRDFSKTTGLEELLRCLSMITVVNESELLAYLTVYDNQFLFQKTGYILSHFKKGLKLSDQFFSKCLSLIGKSVRYFYEDIKSEVSVYNSEWQLFVPNNLMETLDEGGDEIV